MTSRVSQELTTVCRAYGMIDAAIAVSRLQSAGIVVVPLFWQTASVAWHWTLALGGVELRVPASQAEAAMEILSGMETGEPRRPGLLAVAGFVLVMLVATLPPPASGLFPVRAATARLETGS